MNFKIEDYSLVKLDYRVVKAFQGDLKAPLSKDDERKILKSLKDKGKFVPEFVWLDESDGTYYTMDGHRRIEVYTKHDVTFNKSYKIDFLQISASSRQDAKEKLLLLNSHYGKMTRQGLENFVKDMNIEWIEGTASFLEFESLDFLKATEKMAEEMKVMESSMMFETKENKTDEKRRINPIPESKTPVIYDDNEDESFESEDEKEEVYEKSFQTTPTQEFQQKVETKAKDDYVSYNEIMTVEQKQFLVSEVYKVKTEKSFRTNAEALIYIIQQFKEHEK